MNKRIECIIFAILLMVSAGAQAQLAKRSNLTFKEFRIWLILFFAVMIL